MGSCFSSTQAANLAEAALHTVTDYISPSDAAATTPTTPTHPSVTRIIPNCRVTKIPDGDTFTCIHTEPNTTSPTTLRVRVMGIDTPETKQNYGPEAGDLARSVLTDALVTLHVHTTDRYNRTVADVVVSSTGLDFGQYMLRQGAAWHYKAYDKRETYAHLEDQARAQRIGLWAFPRPQQPWEYRRRLRNQS